MAEGCNVGDSLVDRSHSDMPLGQPGFGEFGKILIQNTEDKHLIKATLQDPQLWANNTCSVCDCPESCHFFCILSFFTPFFLIFLSSLISFLFLEMT